MKMEREARCIGCGCTDFHACYDEREDAVTFRRNGAGRFRRNDATGNEQLEGSNGDQGCFILPPFASSVLGDSTPGFGPR